MRSRKLQPKAVIESRLRYSDRPLSRADLVRGLGSGDSKSLNDALAAMIREGSVLRVSLAPATYKLRGVK